MTRVMNIDTHTLYILYGVAGAVVAVLITFVAIAHHRRRKLRRLIEEQSQPLEISTTEEPRLSIVVISQEQDMALDQCLPGLLSQRYTNYEVVVVDAASTDETADVVKRHQRTHDNLRYTFVPQGGRVKDMTTLALMLGLRCARADWCLVIFPDCSPETDEWLARMARHISDDVDIVVGTAADKKQKNFCLNKHILGQWHYSLKQMEKHARKVHEWSPQARIYQRG